MNVEIDKKQRLPNGGLLFKRKYFLIISALTVIAVTITSHNSISMAKVASSAKSGDDVDSNSNDFELAKKESNDFFDDITTQHWQMLKDIAKVHVDHKYPEKPLTHNPHWDHRRMKYFNSHPAWWQSNYEPNFSCQFERRVGFPNGNGDGPKWICDPHRIARMAEERKAKDPKHPGCVIFSIGSNGDFSFESSMSEILGNNTCEFHIFDTRDFSDRMPKEIGRAHFHAWGIGGQQDRGGETNVTALEPYVNRRGFKFYGLKDTLALLGLENLDVIDVFKIDCEGCEYSTFKDWIKPEMPALQQIQVEIHQANPQILNFFDDLQEAGYARFHKEPNIQFNDGSCIEYAFVKLVPDFFPVKNRTYAATAIAESS